MPGLVLACQELLELVLLLKQLSNDQVTTPNVILGFVQLPGVWATQYKRDMGIVNPASGHHGNEKTRHYVNWGEAERAGTLEGQTLESLHH